LGGGGSGGSLVPGIKKEVAQQSTSTINIHNRHMYIKRTGIYIYIILRL